MGGGRWDPSDWATRSAATASVPRSTLFSSKSAVDIAALDPKNFKFRESCDSPANPNSTPIIIGCDVTGSMGKTAELIVKKSLGVIVTDIFEHNPVPDPHIMVVAIGDATIDSAPIQMTQFEAETKLCDQLQTFYLEGGGGGNGGESYLIAWYAAAYRTKCDAFTKGRKGFLFTIGDECNLHILTKEQIKKFFGDDVEANMTREDLLTVLKPNWEVFHLIVQPVGYQPVQVDWQKQLDERAIMCDNIELLGEVISATLRVVSGHDPDKVIKSYSGSTAVTVANAIGGLTKSDSKDLINTSGIKRL